MSEKLSDRFAAQNMSADHAFSNPKDAKIYAILRAHESRTVSEPDWKAVAIEWLQCGGSERFSLGAKEGMIHSLTGLLERTHVDAFAQGRASASTLPAETVEAVREACEGVAREWLCRSCGKWFIPPEVCCDRPNWENQHSADDIADAIRALDLSKFVTRQDADAGDAK